MADNWHAFEPSKFFPKPLQQAVSALDDAFGAITKAQKFAERALRLSQKFADKAAVNPAEVAIRTVLDEIERFLFSISTDAQTHAIIIPIKKRVLRRTKGNNAIQDFLDPKEPAYAYITRALTATGGSEVFFNTLAESIVDPGDPSRPQFDADNAVTGVCVLAGAETLSDLQVPLRLFTTLFAGNLRMPVSARAVPVVQNVKVVPYALQGGVGAVVRWDPLQPIDNVPLLTGNLVVAAEIFVIRIDRPFTRGWMTWSDLFNEEPSDNRNELPENRGAKVVARIQNNGFVVSFTDSRNLLDPKKTYYYTTCVRYAVDTEVQPMGTLSNVVRVGRVGPQPSSRNAVPPDWYATTTLSDMFPPLQDALNAAQFGASRLRSITAVNSGGQQLLQQIVRMTSALGEQYQRTIDRTKELTEKLQLLTQEQSPGGIYATTITKSRGGMDAWMAELARRLSDDTDPSAPELSSQAVVIGFVIVAGAPRLPDLSALIALFELFFGRSTRNPLNEILEEVEGIPGTPAQTTAASSPVMGYTPDMLPSRTPTC